MLLTRRFGIVLFGISAILSSTVLAGESVSGTNDETAVLDIVPEFEVGVDFCSRQLSYGLVDNRDPIVTPSVSLTWLDWLNLNVAFIQDTTEWGDGHKHHDGPCYGNSKWRCQELDAGVGLEHSFTTDDLSILPTTLDLGISYMYEYHPRFSKSKSDGVNGNPDTQFVNVEIGFSDLFINPVFTTEFDVDRDHGTYLNLALERTIGIIDARKGEEENVLELNISIAQGLGDPARNDAYLGVNKWGLMDTSAIVSLSWRPVSWLTISPNIGVTEYLFDRRLRCAAREYTYCGNRETDSWSIFGGVSITASF